MIINKDDNIVENVKFISYDGCYPCLCMGTLILEINNKQYKLENFLSSGGSVWFDDNWGEHVESGEWKIDYNQIPDEIKKYANDIDRIVNDNIPHGCCGGCI